jgi:hypothetical protein
MQIALQLFGIERVIILEISFSKFAFFDGKRARNEIFPLLKTC